MQNAQQCVHPTWGTRRVFLSFFLACAESRFAGESTLPPQAGNASRWAASEQSNPLMYNVMMEVNNNDAAHKFIWVDTRYHRHSYIV
jgi:hypothetical protein